MTVQVRPAPNAAPGEQRVRVSEPVRRTAAIEEFTNAAFIHPVSYRLTLLFARTGVAPNAVSLTGMLCGVLAGVFYHHTHSAACVVAGFLLMIAWHVMDGADGQLARLTRSQSDLGKVLDGVCDYVTFAAVYVGLASALERQHGAVAWLVVAVAGVCHALQAAVYEVQRQEFEIWGCGKPRAVLPATRHPASGRDLPPWQRAADRLNRLYMSVQRAATGADPAASARLADAFGHSPERDAELRDRYRATFAPAVRQWSVMSSNYRTIAIFLFCLFGAPLGYFVFEILGLTAASMVLLLAQRRRQERFIAMLDVNAS